MMLYYNLVGTMLNYKQLYQNSNFQLPQQSPLQLDPFPSHPLLPAPDPTRDAALAKLFQNGQYHFKSFASAYSSDFEHHCAKDSLYPFMLGVGPTKLAIVCREALIVCEWKANNLGRVFEGGDELLVWDKWERAKLTDTPTAITVGRHSAYLGFQSGRIAQYCFRSHAWEGTNEELEFPVMQIEVVREQENKEAAILGLDSAGNIVHIVFSHKTIMDKIIKTLSSARWVSFLFRNKKREKIKKMFKNLLKSEAETQSGSTDTVDSPAAYCYNRFNLKYINNDIFLAVFRRNTLELLVLDQEFQLKRLIMVDDSRKDEKELQVAVVQLGQGGFEHANTTHNVLVLGLGYTVSFFRIIEVEDGYEVVKVTEVQAEVPLLYGGFISNNLLALGDRHQLHLATIGTKPSPLLSLDTLKFSYVDFFADEEGLQVDTRLLLGNLLGLLPSGDTGDRRFIGLEGKRLIVGSIFSWDTILEKLIYQQRWEFAMRCALQIYSLSFKLCCGVSENTATRNEQMKPLCLKITKGYLASFLPFLKLNPTSPESACILNNVIYFLLKAEQAQLLFSEAERLFPENGLEQIFLVQFERYVEGINGYGLKIPYMSQRYLRLVIQRYKSNGKEHVLQNLFMGFDLGQMERLLVLATCLQQALYRSLISICVEQKDYITPIIKLCGIGLNHPEKLNRMSDIIFWYLSECLQCRMTQFGNDNDYLSMLTVLVNFVFIPSSLEMLLAANHHYLFKILTLFFEPRVMRYILQNQDKFFMRKDNSDFPLFEDHCLSEFRIYQKMLGALAGVVEKQKDTQPEYQEELNKFLIPLLLRNHFPFLARLKISIIHYFIAHPLLFSKEKILNEDTQVLFNGQLMRLLDSLVRSVSEKCLNLRQKIKEDPTSVSQLETLLQEEKERQLGKILELMMVSEYSQQFGQTKCYIHHQLGHYGTVLQLYLRMASRRTRLKVFLYLENNVNQYSQLTQQFLRYLLSLLRIDQSRTVRVLWGLREGWADREQVIDKLAEYPALQLCYIERATGQGGERSRKLLLRHLQIVLRERGEQIQKYIASIDYPLEQAFRMCEEHNNRMGKACILIKSGRNMEGVIIISEIFLESVREYLSLLRKGSAEEERKPRILTQFRVVLQTCRKEWLIDNERGEDIWEKNTELIFRKMGVYNIDSPHIPEPIRLFLNEIITELLAAMLEQVSTDFFFHRFAKTFAALPIRVFIQAYSYIYGRLEFAFTLQKLNKEIMLKQELSTWHRIMRATYGAHICKLQCDNCQYAITTNEKMVSYPCHHVFHEECYYELNNKKHKNELCPLCYTSLENFLLCNDSKPPRYRLEVDEKELLRVKMGKMNYYDRTSQITAMESWSKFEEWVDL